MEFEWDMTENEWKRYHNDCISTEYVSDDYYGKVLVGNLSIEFQITEENMPYTNWFCLCKDTRYGYTECGTPYDLFDDWIDVPIECNSFEDFKSLCEKQIQERINTNKILLHEANQLTADWK